MFDDDFRQPPNDLAVRGLATSSPREMFDMYRAGIFTEGSQIVRVVTDARRHNHHHVHVDGPKAIKHIEQAALRTPKLFARAVSHHQNGRTARAAGARTCKSYGRQAL